MANYYAAIEDWDNAMNCIEKTFALRTGIIYVLTDPQFKPIRKWKRYQALEQKIKLPEFNESKLNEIKIKTALKTELSIYASQILYAKSEGNYCILFIFRNFRIEQMLLRISIKSLIDQLPQSAFFQCHRSFIVNKKVAFEIKGNARGYTLTSKKYGFEIPVSRSNISKMKSVFD